MKIDTRKEASVKISKTEVGLCYRIHTKFPTCWCSFLFFHLNYTVNEWK